METLSVLPAFEVKVRATVAMEYPERYQQMRDQKIHEAFKDVILERERS